jgi:hypothetical protein
MAGGAVDGTPIDAIIVNRCRVIRSSLEFWVLELELARRKKGDGDARRWLRVDPAGLLAACAYRLGAARVTAAGPIVPTLVLEGIADLCGGGL